jgi:hypothetical protein
MKFLKKIARQCFKFRLSMAPSSDKPGLVDPAFLANSLFNTLMGH